MAASVSIDIPIYAKFNRELIEVGTLTVECGLKANGRVEAPRARDIAKALKRGKVT